MSFSVEFDPDRVARYRQLAADARRAAALASHANHREAYLNIAKGWASLADHVERDLVDTGQSVPASDGSHIQA